MPLSDLSSSVKNYYGKWFIGTGEKIILLLLRAINAALVILIPPTTIQMEICIQIKQQSRKIRLQYHAW